MNLRLLIFITSCLVLANSADALESTDGTLALARVAASAYQKLQSLGLAPLDSTVLGPTNLKIIDQISTQYPPWANNYANTKDAMFSLIRRFSPDSSKIFLMNARIAEWLGVEKGICHRSWKRLWLEECHQVLGLYVPLLDIILISPDTLLNGETFKRTLLHEYVHAFHYRYRFPLDLTTAAQLANTEYTYAYVPRRLLPPERWQITLHFYYETQAHWWTATTLLNSPWAEFDQRIFSQLTQWPHHPSPDFFGKGPIAAIPNALLLGGEIAASPVVGFVEQAPLPLARAALNLHPLAQCLRPNVDSYLLDRKYKGESGSVAFESTELFPTESPISLDFEDMTRHSLALKYVQARYATKIQHGYFGEFEFLLDPRRANSVNFCHWHNNFRESFGSFENKDLLQKCKALFELTDGRSEEGLLFSPMIQWLRITPAELEMCPQVYGRVNLDALRSYQNLLVSKMRRKGSPISPDPGIEGSDDGVTVVPSAEINADDLPKNIFIDRNQVMDLLPQIEFEP